MILVGCECAVCLSACKAPYLSRFIESALLLIALRRGGFVGESIF
jgi:hypothetical protein